MANETLYREACVPEVCPSELALDLLHVGALSEEERAQVTRKIAECTGCQHRIVLRDQGPPGFATINTKAMVASIYDKVRSSKSESRPQWPWRMSGLAAAALFLLVVQNPRFTEKEVSLDRIQAKGRKLHVFRQFNGQPERMESGSRFFSGDRVRFAITANGAFHVVIVSYEANGERSIYYPLSGEYSAKLPAQLDGAMPGAIQLDSYQGIEWIYLVMCDRPFAASDLMWTRVRDRPTLTAPVGCRVEPFQMIKR